VPWKAGRALVWDATVVDTLAPSYVAASATRAGAAAEIAEERKNSKYSFLNDNHLFVPIAFETMGPISEQGADIITELGRRLSLVTGEPRETSYLFQRISVTIQRFNFVAFNGSFIKPT